MLCPAGMLWASLSTPPAPAPAQGLTSSSLCLELQAVPTEASWVLEHPPCGRASHPHVKWSRGPSGAFLLSCLPTEETWRSLPALTPACKTPPAASRLVSVWTISFPATLGPVQRPPGGHG